MITEREYLKIVNVDHRKKFAQFFTPKIIADFMASWVLNGGEISRAKVLEPAFGLGKFSLSMFNIAPNIRVVGYDIDETIYAYACENFAKSKFDIDLRKENYLTTSWSDKYDGIICNPPYLKFHDYDNAALIPQINSKLNIRLNRFANIYTLFLLKSLFQLKEGGRLAYIVPSEFLNADYGVEVKRTLLQSGTLQHVIIVDYKQCAFDNALTTACILLCQKSNNSGVIHFSNIVDIAKLNTSLYEYKSFNSSELNPELKWKQYYEEVQSKKYNHLVPFSTFAKVTRGIATGANDYFTFKASKIDSFNIPKECFLPCVCHASDVQNLIFTESDFEQLSNSDKTVFLFNGKSNESEVHVKRYLKLGIGKGVNKKYLTASRSPWYALENRVPSPIWVSVFNRNGLRFVRNKSGVYNLTTFHCVYDCGEVDTDILFAYLVTNVAKEIFLDNSRQYGNGLVKFEPNDLNKGKIVDLRLLNVEEKRIIYMISDMLCNNSTCSQLTELLDRFFREKYTSGIIDVDNYKEQLNIIRNTPIIDDPRKTKLKRIKQLNFYDLFEEYGDSSIIENNIVCEKLVNNYNTKLLRRDVFDMIRNVLICFVKKDNQKPYDDQIAKIYYTGKRFPATVSLNKLYYFMPYIKGKGIRDLYLIKKARVGTRKEGQPDNNPNDLRIVFEIEFVKQLFDDYKSIKLEIWRTYTDTTMDELL
ncbi:MAG: Eco57I restriction-modification methylase domain-containing protein [Bacteroidales bacterium]|nr:Eco57I restriction-modification methylase domain-containing protein [Bacteroidales bacterium]